MSYEDSAGLNVLNHFGQRDTGRAAGVIKTEGVKNQLVLDLDAAQISDGLFIENFILPKGANVQAAYFEVSEAFVLGGTTPTLLVGTDGGEVTNGLVVSEAQAEAVGSGLASLAGTWADDSGFAADTTVGVALGGATPTITTAGRIKVIVEYIYSTDI